MSQPNLKNIQPVADSTDESLGATVTIRIPAPLRGLTGGQSLVEVSGSTVSEALNALGESHQGAVERILDGEGQVRGFVNIYLGDRNIRALSGLDTPLDDSAVLSIVPAVAGGGR